MRIKPVIRAGVEAYDRGGVERAVTTKQEPPQRNATCLGDLADLADFPFPPVHRAIQGCRAHGGAGCDDRISPSVSTACSSRANRESNSRFRLSSGRSESGLFSVALVTEIGIATTRLLKAVWQIQSVKHHLIISKPQNILSFYSC